MIRILIFILGLIISEFALSYQDHAPIYCYGKQVLGQIENVVILEKNLKIKAKLDTGAAMSSLSASNIHLFHRDHKEYVSFIFSDPDTHKKIVFTHILERYTRIRNRKSEKENQLHKKLSKRPVIVLSIRIGNQTKKIGINLVDRSDFQYPMLLGSDALQKFHALVDVSQTFLTQ